MIEQFSNDYYQFYLATNNIFNTQSFSFLRQKYRLLPSFCHFLTDTHHVWDVNFVLSLVVFIGVFHSNFDNPGI